MKKNHLRETQESKSERLSRVKKKMADVRREESPSKYVERLARMREYMNYRYSKETEQEKNTDLIEHTIK